MTETLSFDREITFYHLPDSLLTAHGVTLEISPNPDGSLREVRLILRVTPTTYTEIAENNWFNFKLESQNQPESGSFDPNLDYFLEIALQPELLDEFPGVSALDTPSPDAETPVWLQEDNWFVLIVKQTQGDREISLRTFWDYLQLDRLNSVATAGNEIMQGMSNYFKATLSQSLDLPEKSEKSLNLLLEDFLEDLDEDNQSLTSAVQNFFNEDDWDYIASDGGSILQMAFQGEKYRWNCLAQVYEDDRQFLFYSITPIELPPERYLAMSEFITRANCSLVLGNFEMDFSNGEVRYKTSIDVEGDRLSYALINQLVYVNVLTVDQYLPGLFAVAQGTASPLDAIALALVECKEPIFNLSHPFDGH